MTLQCTQLERERGEEKHTNSTYIQWAPEWIGQWPFFCYFGSVLWVWKDTMTMRVKCRLSALIWGYFHTYRMKRLGFIEAFVHGPPHFRASKNIGQFNIMQNKVIIVNIWSHITRRWVSFLVMLCQACTAAIFSSYLFRGLIAFSLLFSMYNACSIGFRSGDWLGQSRIFHFLAIKNPFVVLAVC